jgi:hypothetical protein
MRNLNFIYFLLILLFCKLDLIFCEDVAKTNSVHYTIDGKLQILQADSFTGIRIPLSV